MILWWHDTVLQMRLLPAKVLQKLIIDQSYNVVIMPYIIFFKRKCEKFIVELKKSNYQLIFLQNTKKVHQSNFLFASPMFDLWPYTHTNRLYACRQEYNTWIQVSDFVYLVLFCFRVWQHRGLVVHFTSQMLSVWTCCLCAFPLLAPVSSHIPRTCQPGVLQA